MAHRSWCAEHPGTLSNERLEFLGDAVLGWVVADLAFRRFTDLPEGDLTGVRKGVVNALALASVAERLGLGEFLRLGRGEDAAGGREKPSILSDALEAVLGAVYVDGGPAVAYDVVERLIGPGLAATAARLDHLDHKSRLQELVAMAGGPPPEYTTRAEGPDHAKRFFAAVTRGWASARRGDRPLQEGRRAGRRRGRLRSLAHPWRLMPELPEVETVRRGLADRVVGRRIDRVEVGRPRTVRRTSATEVIDGLTGASMIAANRRGKYLLCPLDTGDTVMFHLRMSGQLLLAADGAPRPAHTHVALSLAGPDREQLLFVDPRTFGEVVVFDPDHVEVELPELARLGVDPLADGLGLDALIALLGGRRTALKPLLLDQHVIAGIGNIYADEILHAARLHPSRPAGSLRRAEVRRLHDAVHRILAAAVEARGSSLGDGQYVDLMGAGGSYQDSHAVYGRVGTRCPTCGRGIIRRTVSAGRSTYYCGWCQRRA